jgi:protein TonB
VSKIYDELKRAQQSKSSRQTIPLDLLSSVIEKVSPTIPAAENSETEIQLGPGMEQGREQAWEKVKETMQGPACAQDRVAGQESTLELPLAAVAEAEISPASAAAPAEEIAAEPEVLPLDSEEVAIPETRVQLSLDTAPVQEQEPEKTQEKLQEPAAQESSAEVPKVAVAEAETLPVGEIAVEPEVTEADTPLPAEDFAAASTPAPAEADAEADAPAEEIHRSLINTEPQEGFAARESSSDAQPSLVWETELQLTPEMETQAAVAAPSQPGEEEKWEEEVYARRATTENHVAAPRAWESFRWPAVALAGLVLFAALGFVLLRPKNSSKTANVAIDAGASPSLDLKSEREGSDWRVSWNRNAPALQQATGAHISISDGATRKEFDLGPGELRNGSLVYSPISDNVLLQLQLKYKDSRQAESAWVRIVAGSRSGPPGKTKVPSRASVSAVQPPARTGPMTTAAGATTTGATAVVAAPKLAAAAVPSAAEARSAKTEAVPVERPVPASSSPMNSAPVAASSAKAADAVSEPASGKAAAVASTPAPPPAESAPKSPASAPAAAPVAAIAPTAPAGSTSPGAVAPGAVLDPAKLLRGGSPVYPAIARQTNIRGSVEVRFRITATGEVTNAVAVSGSPVLGRAAVDAVKSWRYTPARMNGAPVESESRVTFQFQPN